jgi:hypothetical protein
MNFLKYDQLLKNENLKICTWDSNKNTKKKYIAEKIKK